MYIVLFIICWMVSYFPVVLVSTGFLAYYSLGRLVMTVGDGLTTTIIKIVLPICLIVSVVLSVIMTVLVWRHYEDTVSRGKRRWMSNLKFFQNRVGFTAATLFESLVINFLLTFSVFLLILTNH